MGRKEKSVESFFQSIWALLSLERSDIFFKMSRDVEMNRKKCLQLVCRGVGKWCIPIFKAHTSAKRATSEHVTAIILMSLHGEQSMFMCRVDTSSINNLKSTE